MDGFMMSNPTSLEEPLIDRVFPFEQLKEAYQYQWDQKVLS